jgi:antitoxin component HigA of HigAB toxin-antitoxin module
MTANASRSTPTRFAELTALHPLRPLRSERDLAGATEIADRLAVLSRRTRDQEDYLETLSLLIEAYEDAHHAIETSHLSPIDVLKAILSDHGLTASDLGRILGNRSLGGAILRGQRQLSKAHIQTLCQRFAVGPELFLKAPARRRRAG